MNTVTTGSRQAHGSQPLHAAEEHWVVTGAGSGIGLGLVTRLLREGARVTACVRSDEQRASLQSATYEHCRELTIAVLDAREDVEARAVADASSHPIDVLVACAGVFGSRHSARDCDFEEVLTLFSVNALGPLRAVRAFLPRLVRGTHPRIALVSSVLGSMSDTSRAFSNLGYRVSKVALNKIVQALAADLQRDGITVIALEPGWVRTQMGGDDAPLSVDESVSGILATLGTLTIGQSGRFLDYRGEVVPW